MKTPSLNELEPETMAMLVRRRDRVATELAEARDALACDAPTASAHDLSYRLIRLAGHEGRLLVLRTVVRLAETGKSGEIRDWLMTQATRGAEDSWSGRTNDTARARHDGVLDAIREATRDIDGI